MTPIESITRTIYRPHKNLVLELKVVLGSANAQGQRKKFITNFEYESQKYYNIGKLNSLKIETTDYLILKSYADINNRSPNWKASSVIFSYDNIHQLNIALSNAYDWMDDSSKVYTISPTGNVALDSLYSGLFVECRTLHGRGYSDLVLRLAPTVQMKDDGSSEKAVLVMMGTNLKQICSLNQNEVGALLYTINHFDLCLASMELVNQSLIALPYNKGQ